MRHGLPTLHLTNRSYLNMSRCYSQHERIYVAVDCIIFGINNRRLSLLLTKRKFEPELGKWSLMGGFVAHDEGADEAAQRVLRELTGLSNVYMEQVGAFGDVDRDPGERVISIAYSALINITDEVMASTGQHNGCWVPLDEIPPLGFDHPKMIEKARQIMKINFTNSPVAFNLLPELFTLSQLQGLYETVLDEEIDKRNFRKRINDLPCIVPTDRIDKSNSRRGARLHRFDRAVYAENQKFKI